MKKILLLTLTFICYYSSNAQNTDNGYWHGIERELRYTPDGEDFVIINGKRKFTRALYGTNTPFRVETGDVPEFALFMPNMGGNLQFGLHSSRSQKEIRLNDAQRIEARYRPGSRIYTIEDPILGEGKIIMTALAMADADGFLLKTEFIGVPEEVRLMWVFGGASDIRLDRNGDMGADPESVFYLLPEYCSSNKYTIEKKQFRLEYGDNKQLCGIFPEEVFLSDARRVTLGRSFDTTKDEIQFPVIRGAIEGVKTPFYIALYNPESKSGLNYNHLTAAFEAAENFRKSIAGRIQIHTPDPYLNAAGSALAIAGDAIWEEPVYLHGAIGWRVQLPGWRGAYTGDFLGWHDRARIHFDAYGAAQFTDEPTLPVIMDTTLHLARSAKVRGTPMYSSGYIGRYPRPENAPGQMNHYDMNIVYIDALLWHLNWTGDLEYAKKIWPVLERHLTWEKRNFDPEDDGLYDAYCCIWASDALQYNSGAVTHSTAYNYRANKMAAEIAEKIGKDPTPYRNEARKILDALNATLWMPYYGHWAEFQEKGGHNRLHPNAGVWTFYHAVDSEAGDPFRLWQAGEYINKEIPHIPVKARNYDDGKSYVVSTTNWMPYFWSINNVAIAESAHTALGLWQAGHPDAAFNLLKGQILDVMYMGGSPGNTGQVSFYDSARGETYRDFADPTGVLSRSFVQGLFGIDPDLMNHRVEIRPGYPVEWEYASFATPDIGFEFKRNGLIDNYTIKQDLPKGGSIILQVPARYDSVKKVMINGRPYPGYFEISVGRPTYIVDAGNISVAEISIEWEGNAIETEFDHPVTATNGEQIQVEFGKDQVLLDFFDPQGVLEELEMSERSFRSFIQAPETGHRTFFAKIRQGDAIWHQPITLEVLPVEPEKPWSFTMPSGDVKYEPVDISGLWNDRVTQIFKNKYLSPRSPHTTLQIPWQGIGEWCVPLMDADIDDAALRSATRQGIYHTSLGIPFTSEADSAKNNTVFTSLWDNYPDSVDIPLKGNASHVYLLMAGSTNHMQCHMVNGTVKIFYKDGSHDTLELVNPETWPPIEQDFFTDEYAFRMKGERPFRIQLSTGLTSRTLGDELGLKGASDRRIPGGAATILDLALDRSKELDKLTLTTESLEVVIGLMGVTLVR